MLSAGISGCARRASRAVLLAALAAMPASHAFGPAGHAIAGDAAEPLLCDAARAGIARLVGGGAGLADIGQWADRIRSDERYAASAPWHFMNVADDADLEAHAPPPEGDVLDAIRRFRARLADTTLASAERADALRFVVHFIVDVHQPLHVGRAADRGGNTIDVRVDGDTMNLHRFWDSGAIAADSRGTGAFAADVAAQARRRADEPPLTPVDWAGESLALRPFVYSFGGDGAPLSDAYVGRAQRITSRRLAQAAVRLAATLNSVFCGG